jgi:ribosomal protein S18 acetylase RimI-like enzyme
MSAPAAAGLVVARATTNAQLEQLVEVRRRVDPDANPTVEGLRHSQRRSPQLRHYIATAGDALAGCGMVGPFPGNEANEYVMADFSVVPTLRGRGVGTELYRIASGHARSLGKIGLTLEVREDDPGSLSWVERRGFVEVERQKAVALDLTTVAATPPSAPDGVVIVSRRERPDVERGMYAVAVEASGDIPGLDSDHDPTFEQWRSYEIDPPSAKPELSFAALAGDEVVGYATLRVYGDPATGFHGLTAVARAWRRRGIATALKRAEIEAARRLGLRRLMTESEERNEPMLRLNEKLGYVPVPGMIVLRGPLAEAP